MQDKESKIKPISEPVISVICTTYNHEKYISRALKSFVNQKIEVPFEIIVHDDASTDKTPQIIKEFAQTYPHLIIPVFQTENQYSQRKSIAQNFIKPIVRGKYIATCEGDDYWIDDYKLRKQYNLLENNPEYIGCYHKVAIVNTQSQFLGKYFGIATSHSKKITLQDLYRGISLHISSLFVKQQYYFNRPTWITRDLYGDWQLALSLVLTNKMYYLNETLSAYRRGVENSLMTNSLKNYSVEATIADNQRRMQVLKDADKFYDYEFSSDFKKMLLPISVRINILSHPFSKLASQEFREYIRNWGLKSFIRLVVINRLRIFTIMYSRIRQYVYTRISNQTI